MVTKTDETIEGQFKALEVAVADVDRLKQQVDEKREALASATDAYQDAVQRAKTLKSALHRDLDVLMPDGDGETSKERVRIR